jgi:D-serine deaminase-like pyridoxal phosphate-dependent protein
VSLLTEDPDHAREVRALGVPLGLFVDLDPRFGRSGIPFQDRGRIASTLEACGDALAGLHAYEGHVRAPLASDRARACAPLFDELVEIAREHGLERRELVTSGTPTFVEALEHAGLARLEHCVSPGIVVYWDTNSEAFGLCGFQLAATLFARVISAPAKGRATLDAGSKSLDAAAGDPCASIVGWPGLTVLHASEEHLPLEVRSGAAPAPGALLELAPRHVCPMINLADSVALLEGDELVRVVPVAARGHEA